MKIKLANANECFLIDEEDRELVEKINWRRTQHGYIDGYSKGKRVFLHRYLVFGNERTNKVVDHVNYDVLDNRRTNLRVCSHQQNTANMRPKRGTSKYKGVCWNKVRNGWQAQIMQNGKVTFLGIHSNEDNAALVYNKKAKELWGEFAFLNTIPLTSSA